MRACLLALAGAALAGCTDAVFVSGSSGAGLSLADAGVDPRCPVSFVGDRSKAMEIELVALGADAKARAVDPGGPIALVPGVEGGHLIVAGARVRNVDPCNVALAGAMKDPLTHAVTIDQRTVNLAPTSDGWAASVDGQIETFSNIPVCPNEWSTSNIYGTPFELVLTVTDREGRSATASATVVPACPATDAGAADPCAWICKAGYVLGSACDAGP